MPKSLREEWQSFKKSMANIDMSKIPKPMQADVKKKLETALKGFDGGFGPTLDKFEACEKKGDKAGMKALQPKLEAIMKDYQSKANAAFEGFDQNVVTRQIGVFKAEIDKRAK